MNYIINYKDYKFNYKLGFKWIRNMVNFGYMGDISGD